MPLRSHRVQRSISSRSPAVHLVSGRPLFRPCRFHHCGGEVAGHFLSPPCLHDAPSSLKSRPVIGAPVRREWLYRKAGARAHAIMVGVLVYLCHIIKEEELIIHRGHHDFPYSIFPITGIWNKQQCSISFISCFSSSGFFFFYLTRTYLFSQQSPAQHVPPDTVTDLRELRQKQKWTREPN